MVGDLDADCFLCAALEEDEPRTIAIGARASLLKRPIIWENHAFVSNRLLEIEKRDHSSYWDHLQVSHRLGSLFRHTAATVILKR